MITKKKILVVDDDELVLKSIKALLVKHDWMVDTCNNPLDALRLIRDDKYDCLLLDIRMPQLSGTELLKRIRGLESEGLILAQQVIFLTGYADQDARQKAFEFGAFNYVSKPFEAADLIRRLNRCVAAKIFFDEHSSSELVRPLDKSFDFIIDKQSIDNQEAKTTHRLSFESINAKINVVTPEELFWWYAKTGFFYPSKKRKLTPYLPIVEDCWRKALKLGEDVFWIATVADAKTNSWASICNWRTTYSGWVSQHLIGTGHAAYPLMLMLATQTKVINESKNKPYQSFQNWYRPTNKYANKVFGLLGAAINKESRCVKEFAYYLISRGLKIEDPSICDVLECTNDDPRDIKTFLEQNHSEVYFKAEEFDGRDIELLGLDDIYKSVGLTRKRTLFLAYNKLGRPVGALVVRKGPVGINFSLIENSAELILEEGLAIEEKQGVCLALLARVGSAYADFSLPFVPLITDIKNIDLMSRIGQKSIRTYDQFIWLKSGYEDWYDALFDISKLPINRWKKYVNS